MLVVLVHFLIIVHLVNCRQQRENYEDDYDSGPSQEEMEARVPEPVHLRSCRRKGQRCGLGFRPCCPGLQCIRISKDELTCLKPGGKKCPEGEIYKSCGITCPPTCKNPDPMCSFKCGQGCYCKKGYVRDKKWNCVSPYQCFGSSSPIWFPTSTGSSPWWFY